MKRKILSLMFALCLVTAAIPVVNCTEGVETDSATVWRSSADGNTYYITTPEELMTMAQMINDGSTTFSGKTFVMLNDIDMTGKAWIPAGFYTAATTDFARSFAGTFDGNGYSIRNLTVDTTEMPYYSGLFGCTNGATIKNLTLERATVDSSQYSGGIVGYASNTTLDGCVLDANSTVTSTTRVGGIAGLMLESHIEYCVNDGTIVCKSESSTYSSYAGGVVGVFFSSDSNSMSYCVNNGSVTGSCPKNNFVGGLIGLTDSGGNNSTVSNCANTGTLSVTTGTVAYVGGIAGRTGNAASKTHVITDCFNNGSIVETTATSNYVGGILGRLGAGGNSTTTISNCKYDNTKEYTKDFGSTASVGTSTRTLENNGPEEPDVISAAISAIQGRIDAERVKSTELYGYQATGFDCGYCDIRLVATVNNADALGEYTAVGFEIEMTTETSKMWTNMAEGVAPSITSVYASVIADGVEKTAEELGGDYIYVATVAGLKQDSGKLVFVVKCFHDDADGNRIYDDVSAFIFNTAVN